METINIRKKELAELVHTQKFTGRDFKVNLVWFDWKAGDYIDGDITKSFKGFKYMVAIIGSKTIGLDKTIALDLMHHWLTSGVRPTGNNVKTWTAKTDQERKKIPLQFIW